MGAQTQTISGHVRARIFLISRDVLSVGKNERS